MNDFFTELDSDLVGSTIPSATPVNAPEKKEPPRVFHKMPVNTTRKQSEPIKKRENKAPRKSGVIPVHVAEARSQMMQSGVVVVVFKADEKTKMLLGHLRLETRGFVYLDEIREMHKIVIKKARASYEDTMKDVPDIEEKELIKIIRHDLEIFIQNKIKRNPVIIPMILYV